MLKHTDIDPGLVVQFQDPQKPNDPLLIRSKPGSGNADTKIGRVSANGSLLILRNPGNDQDHFETVAGQPYIWFYVLANAIPIGETTPRLMTGWCAYGTINTPWFKEDNKSPLAFLRSFGI